LTVALLVSDPALGSAGTLQAHADELAGGPCVVLARPGLHRVDLQGLLRAHAQAGALLTVGVRTARGGEASADVLIAGDDGRVIGVQAGAHPDEALSDLVDAGVYVVSPAALHHLGPPPAEIAAELLPALLAWDAAVHVHPVGA
jgi:NDP-sugar pyrophosphorylase family protein